MSNPLARKLQCYVRLSETDLMWLDELLVSKRVAGARGDILSEGDDPRAVNVILDGWACRYKQLANGRRQIVGFLLPGDVCDPNLFLLDEMDHTIGAITPVLLGHIAGTALQAATARSPCLDLAFRREALVTAAIQREWTVSLGCRTGVERLAHLFCELHTRLSAVDRVDGNTCSMPMTQHDLAEAMGQTSVHINRTLQELRSQGLITLRSKRLTIHDPAALARLAQFDATYLHLTAHVEHAVPVFA